MSYPETNHPTPNISPAIVLALRQSSSPSSSQPSYTNHALSRNKQNDDDTRLP